MLEDKIDLVLDSPGNCDVSRLHAIIKCWRGPDPNTWLSRIYDEKGAEGGAGQGPGGGHSGGGTTVDGEQVDPVLGTPLETGSVLRFGVREMWVFERAPMHLRSQAEQLHQSKIDASNAVDSALQRCPDWFSIVRVWHLDLKKSEASSERQFFQVVLECRLEPDEPACVDCIETQDECGRTVGRHEAYSLTAQQKYDIQRILREIKVGGTVRLRLSNDPKLLAPILEYLEQQRVEMQQIYQSRAQATCIMEPASSLTELGTEVYLTNAARLRSITDKVDFSDTVASSAKGLGLVFEDGVLKLDGLIAKGHQYIESDKGTELLRKAQEKALDFTKAGLFEQANGYIQQLEQSENSKNSRALV
eukprot:g33293.t1